MKQAVVEAVEKLMAEHLEMLRSPEREYTSKYVSEIWGMARMARLVGFGEESEWMMDQCIMLLEMGVGSEVVA